ncbi:hypothetical protein BDB00DRAFT_843201, partial [Zychaea mexicana]|uniref:uncharacterized protein n=1 Tax=Zychaea mexicana TaxID=64656 RepID=UPI0022FDE189
MSKYVQLSSTAISSVSTGLLLLAKWLLFVRGYLPYYLVGMISLSLSELTLSWTVIRLL